MTVLTTFGMSIFSPLDSFRVFVPYATSCRNEGLDMKSRKWSTLTGSSLVRVMVGGSMGCPGLV